MGNKEMDPYDAEDMAALNEEYAGAELESIETKEVAGYDSCSRFLVLRFKGKVPLVVCADWIYYLASKKDV